MEYLMYYIRFASTLYRIFSFIRDIGLEVFIYFLFICLFIHLFIAVYYPYQVLVAR